MIAKYRLGGPLTRPTFLYLTGNGLPDATLAFAENGVCKRKGKSTAGAALWRASGSGYFA